MYNDIYGKVTKLVHDLFGIDTDITNKEHALAPLTGQHFGFNGNELVYLLFEIENAFNIKFLEEDVIFYKFNTLDGIVNTIIRRLESC